MYEADFQDWELPQNSDGAHSRIDDHGTDREMDHMAHVDVCLQVVV